MAMGSLLLSVIGVLLKARASMPFLFRHTTPLRGAGQPASNGPGVANAASLRGESVRYSIDQKPRERSRERLDSAAIRPCKRHRHLLRDFRQRQCRTAAADYGVRRP